MVLKGCEEEAKSNALHRFQEKNVNIFQEKCKSWEKCIASCPHNFAQNILHDKFFSLGFWAGQRVTFILQTHKSEIQTSLGSRHASSRFCSTPCPHIRSEQLQLIDSQVSWKQTHIMASVLLPWVLTAPGSQFRPVQPSCASGGSLVPVRLCALDSGWQIKCFTCALGRLIWQAGFSRCFYKKKWPVSVGKHEAACLTQIISVLS